MERVEGLARVGSDQLGGSGLEEPEAPGWLAFREVEGGVEVRERRHRDAVAG
jgi:hypothetical protein